MNNNNNNNEGRRRRENEKYATMPKRMGGRSHIISSGKEHETKDPGIFNPAHLVRHVFVVWLCARCWRLDSRSDLVDLRHAFFARKWFYLWSILRQLGEKVNVEVQLVPLIDMGWGIWLRVTPTLRWLCVDDDATRFEWPTTFWRDDIVCDRRSEQGHRQKKSDSATFSVTH